MIGECHSVEIDEDVAGKYRLMASSQDAELFLEFCLHTILYQQSSQGYGGSSIFKQEKLIFSFLGLRKIMFYFFSVKDPRQVFQLFSVIVLLVNKH